MRKVLTIVGAAALIVLVATPAAAKQRIAPGTATAPAGSTMAAARDVAAPVAYQLCKKYKVATSADIAITAGDVTATFRFNCEVIRVKPPATTTSTTTTTTTVPPTTAAPPTAPPNPPCMSMDEFNQIQAGMSHDDVTAIVGGPGTLSVSSDVAGYHGEIGSTRAAAASAPTPTCSSRTARRSQKHSSG